MYDHFNYGDRGLLSRVKSGEVSAENARSWFRNRTFSRARLVKFLSMKTVEGSNDYPCNAASGPRAGEACSFPFLFPDCQLMQKPLQCKSYQGSVPLEYQGCYKEDTDRPWCYTRTYNNRSHILGEWGYCSHLCSLQTVRSESSKPFWIFVRKYFIVFSSDDPQYNLASSLHSSRWEEGVYSLYETGHCHTFNPENVSLSGLQGQHYFNLGKIWYNIFSSKSQ